jgi:CheY-like chemotaxis protein
MPRILVIDDSKFMRVLVRGFLEGAGYEVEEASDGGEGIGVYREKSIDLIITDLIMPNKEGIETIGELRAEFPEIKIIAMSGGGSVEAESYLQMAKMLGANHTLTKPFEEEALLEAVRRLLGNS